MDDFYEAHDIPPVRESAKNSEILNDHELIQIDITDDRIFQAGFRTWFREYMHDKDVTVRTIWHIPNSDYRKQVWDALNMAVLANPRIQEISTKQSMYGSPVGLILMNLQCIEKGTNNEYIIFTGDDTLPRFYFDMTYDELVIDASQILENLEKPPLKVEELNYITHTEKLSPPEISN